MNTITEAENDGLKTSTDGREIKLNNVVSVLKGIASEKLNWSKLKKEYINITDDVDAVL